MSFYVVTRLSMSYDLHVYTIVNDNDSLDD